MKIYLCVETFDGDDAIEAEVDLPCVPQVGWTIEMWYQGGDGALGYSKTDYYPEVEDVVVSVYRPEYVRVYLRFDEFDLELVRSIMDCAARGITP